MKTRMESWLVSKLVKKRPPIDRRRFSPVFPIPELQQTATAKDKSCTYISNENRRCSLFSRWINPAAISNKKPFGSSPPENQCSKETVTARRGWTPVTRFKFHAKGTPDRPEIKMFSDTKNTRVSPANGREFQINGTRSFNYSNQQKEKKYNLSSGVSVLHYYAHFRLDGFSPWHEIWILWLVSSPSEQ